MRFADDAPHRDSSYIEIAAMAARITAFRPSRWTIGTNTSLWRTQLG